MPLEKNGTLQKWHMTSTPPEIEKYDTYKKWYLTKMAYLAQCKKNAERLFSKDRAD